MGKFSIGSADMAGARSYWLYGSGELIRHRRGLSPVWLGFRFRPLARLLAEVRRGHMRRPEVGTTRAGDRSAAARTPGGDLGVITAGEHIGDRPTLPQLGPGILRVFEQAVGKALLRARGLLCP